MNKIAALSLIFLALFIGSSYGDEAEERSLRQLRRYASHAKEYKNICKDRECCMPVDVECSETRKLLFYFPHGISFCENLYYKGDKENPSEYYVYCVGNPDPVTKEVVINECPQKWGGNSPFELSYGLIRNSEVEWFDEERYFEYHGYSLIREDYILGKYKARLETPLSLHWIDKKPRAGKLPYKDVTDMICLYSIIIKDQ